MQILVKQDDNSIVQGQLNRDISETTDVNGMYLIHHPLNLNVAMTESSYVLNAGAVDSGSIVTQMFNDLLTEFPTYSKVSFNAFVQLSDLSLLDLTASIQSPVDPLLIEISRFQVGRVLPTTPVGLYPNTVALLPQNNTVTPVRPGVLVTNSIDVVAIAGSPKTNFMVYWKILNITTSEDINNSTTNTPANRQIVETEQEPDSLKVLFYADGGSTGLEVGRLQAFTTAAPVSTCKLAFRNTSNSKVYLAAYAILF